MYVANTSKLYVANCL